jgi:hypothetical protein
MVTEKGCFGDTDSHGTEGPGPGPPETSMIKNLLTKLLFHLMYHPRMIFFILWFLSVVLGTEIESATDVTTNGLERNSFDGCIETFILMCKGSVRL